ncbi:MAG: cupin domain-containing protein [Chloroflexi bacterium]|nr:cupin domain-containing protein [Chloroflexota bacterium]
MAGVERKDMGKGAETRTFEKGKIETVKLAGGTVGRFTLQPGWKWSQHVKPVVKTQLCESTHFGYHISGKLRIRMADGTEQEVGPGEVSFVPSGHDAWVVGNQPVVLIDWSGAATYAKR